MEFREYSNPEERDYDITSSYSTNSSSNESLNQYVEQLFDLIGILEDITDEELMENYGISMQEYLRPTKDTIRKVEEKLNSIQNGRHR